MSWLIFAPRKATEHEDPGLWQSYQVACWLRDRAKEHSPQWVGEEAATRDGLEAALADKSIRGLAFHGHGERTFLCAVDKQHEALNHANVHLLAGRWVHAFACRSGGELGHHAVDAGAEIYVGYDVGLIPEWPSNMPSRLEELVATLTTCTSLQLANGERDKRTLLRSVDACVDAIDDWLSANDPDDTLAHVLVVGSQLQRRMQVIPRRPQE